MGSGQFSKQLTTEGEEGGEQVEVVVEEEEEEEEEGASAGQSFSLSVRCNSFLLDLNKIKQNPKKADAISFSFLILAAVRSAAPS